MQWAFEAVIEIHWGAEVQTAAQTSYWTSAVMLTRTHSTSMDLVSLRSSEAYNAGALPPASTAERDPSAGGDIGSFVPGRDPSGAKALEEPPFKSTPVPIMDVPSGSNGGPRSWPDVFAFSRMEALLESLVM